MRVRRLILLILSDAMLLGGSAVVGLDLLFARFILSRAAIAGGMLALLGGYLLWTDLVAPRLGIRTWED